MFGIYHWIALGLFGAFAVLEIAARSRRWPEIVGWRLKGAAFTLLYFAITTFAPLAWDEWLGRYQLLDASALPFWAQVACGFLVLEGGIYLWHRTMHRHTFLWRWFHQMHHSAERLDVWGAFYFHPFDMIGWALVGSLALVLGIGLSGEAALVVNVMAAFCAMFQHLNIRTPRWLGYIVQRPESHSIHHKRGHHANNYGDLPLFDLIFGTFANPKEFQREIGFHDGASHQVRALLRGELIA